MTPCVFFISFSIFHCFVNFVSNSREVQAVRLLTFKQLTVESDVLRHAVLDVEGHGEGGWMVGGVELHDQLERLVNE